MLFYESALKCLEEDFSNLAALTQKTYLWNLKKIYDFSPELQCEDICEKTVQDYREHLVSLKNKPSTVAKALSVFRVFVNKLTEKGLVQGNPFANTSIGRVSSKRVFLSIQELKALSENFAKYRPTLSEPEQDSMRAFLFACFTGLRFSDLKVLEKDEIVDWKIRKKDAQSEEIIYIPIPEQARSLIPKRFTNGPVFRIVDNSHFNRTLRIAAEKLGCKKRINCNMARHTFATVCIFLGIPVTAISKILGHKSADSTLIYTKYVEPHIEKEMEKLNQAW